MSVCDITWIRVQNNAQLEFDLRTGVLIQIFVAHKYMPELLYAEYLESK